MYNHWMLTISDVLTRPLFAHAEVVAGTRGLGRPIRWVHVLETAENASFLNGGELILTTGVGFGKSADKRLFYLKEVIRRKAVGLCIELGAYIPEIPADMKELADHHEFPLVIFSRPVRFVDITLDLHESIVNRQTKALREMEGYARDLQRLTLQTQSLPRLLSHFQQMIHSQTFFIGLDGTVIFAPCMPQSVQQELTGLVRTSLLESNPLTQTSGRFPVSERKHCFYQPIMAMGNVLAYLGVILYETEPGEFYTLLLDYTATAIAQIMLRKMFARERSLDNENLLLEDILQGKAGTGDHIRSLLGISNKSSELPRYWAAIMGIQQIKPLISEETDSPLHDLLAVFRLLISKEGFRPFFRNKGHRLYFLLVETRPLKNPRQSLQNALAGMRETSLQALSMAISLRFGVSNSSNDYGRVGLAFLEAGQVLALPAGFQSPFYQDLGMYRLLLQTDRSELDSFINDYLGPLLAYDEKHGGQLTTTLRVFLDLSQAKQEAAEQLYIRRQTLYHRLEKIREILGEDCLTPANRLNLELALKAYDWLHGQKPGHYKSPGQSSIN